MPYTRTSTRTLYALGYAALSSAGGTLLLVLGSIPGIVTPLWGVMAAWLLLGGLLGIISQLRRRWTGEFVGLPLLFSSLFGFGILQGNLSGWVLAVVPSVAILWAFALALLSRWFDVGVLYRASRREQP